MKWKNFLIPGRIRKQRQALREQGIKGFARQLGWKALLLVIVFYLIRDTILYLIIPYLVAKGVLTESMP